MFVLFGQRSPSFHASTARSRPRGPHAVITCYVSTLVFYEGEGAEMTCVDITFVKEIFRNVLYNTRKLSDSIPVCHTQKITTGL